LSQICAVYENKIYLKKSFETVLRHSCAVFCRNLRICGMTLLRNLRICDYAWEFADVRISKKVRLPTSGTHHWNTTLKPAVLRFKIRMVFGPSGSWSGSIGQRYGSRSRSGYEPFYHQAKIVLKKTWFRLVCNFFTTFYFWKMMYVTSISNKQKYKFFMSWMSLMKIASMMCIHGSVSVPKCHGSATLEARSTFLSTHDISLNKAMWGIM
jgi:hypothetical protein